MDRKLHWQNVFCSKASSEVGWYQPHLRLSLELIAQTGLGKSARILDVGGGDSTLVDDLVAQGYSNVSVLDISSTALDRAKARLGARADQVNWIEADIIQAELPSLHYDLWHDRAMFHFLTSAEDRKSYASAVERALKPQGHLIVATFAADGPQQCSGLETMRYSPEKLLAEFGENLTLVKNLPEAHRMPSGTLQKFSYCHLQKRA